MNVHRRIRKHLVGNSNTSQTDHSLTQYKESNHPPTKPFIIRRLCTEYISKMNMLNQIHTLLTTLQEPQNFLASIKEKKYFQISPGRNNHFRYTTSPHTFIDNAHNSIQSKIITRSQKHSTKIPFFQFKRPPQNNHQSLRLLSNSCTNRSSIQNSIYQERSHPTIKLKYAFTSHPSKDNTCTNISQLCKTNTPSSNRNPNLKTQILGFKTTVEASTTSENPEKKVKRVLTKVQSNYMYNSKRLLPASQSSSPTHT
jgi:hypothetical protein